MNYRQAKIVLVIIIIFLIAGLSVCCVKCCRRSTGAMDEGVQGSDAAAASVSEKIAGKVTEAFFTEQKLDIASKVNDYARQFNDLNEEHLAYARKIGITPIAKTSDIIRGTVAIEKIETCDDFVVDRLTHSYPYLVTDAAGLLHEIGMRFNSRLAQAGGGNYRIKVTSVLRTNESVGRLQRRNVNSTENSAHLYGTTFDISYVDFPQGRFNTRTHSDGELKKLLATVLLELKEEGRCLVKHERKQGCFHVTATGTGNLRN